MQMHVNLVDLVESFPTSIYLQNLASMQPRTSLWELGIWTGIWQFERVKIPKFPGELGVRTAGPGKHYLPMDQNAFPR